MSFSAGRSRCSIDGRFSAQVSHRHRDRGLSVLPAKYSHCAVLPGLLKEPCVYCCADKTAEPEASQLTVYDAR